MAFAALSAVLELDNSDFKSGIQDSRDEVEDFGDRVESVGRTAQKAGGAMTAGLTLPLAGAAAQSARLAADFEESMNASMSVMGDVSDAMEEKLEQGAREVATSTTLSAAEAADAYYYLASAGLDAAEALEAMPQVSDFAEAGQLSLSEATDVATNAMSAYGLEASELNRVTDVMVASTTRHNQTVEGMADAFRNAAPAAASMGIEMEELAALTGALGDVGIQGAEAGTALNSIMRRFARDGGEAAQTLEELGVETTTATGELRPLTEIIRDLQDENLGAAETSALFGRQMSAGNALLSAGADELEEYQAEIAGADGSTEEMADDMRDNFNAELQMARDNLAEVGITIGTDLLPYMNMLVNAVSDGAEVFGNLSDRQQTAIIGLGGLAAIAGPAILVLGTLITNLVAVGGALGTVAGLSTTAAGAIGGALLPSSVAGSGGLLGLAASAVTAQVALGPITVPIWAIILALGVLIAMVGAVAYAFYNDFYGMRTAVEDAVDGILERFFGIENASDRVAGAIGDFVDRIIDHINRIPGVDIGGEGIGLSIGMPDDELDPVEEMETSDHGSLGGEMDFAADGEMAGQDFGQGFNQGASSAMDESQIRRELNQEIDALENELEDLDEGITSLDEQDRMREIRDELSELEDARDRLGPEEEGLSFDPAEITAADADGGGQDLSGLLAQDRGDGGTQRMEIWEKMLDEFQELKSAFESGLELTDIDGEIETDEGHIIRIVDGRLERAGRQSNNRGIR